jgi:hypothetical protein
MARWCKNLINGVRLRQLKFECGGIYLGDLCASSLAAHCSPRIFEWCMDVLLFAVVRSRGRIRKSAINWWSIERGTVAPVHYITRVNNKPCCCWMRAIHYYHSCAAEKFKMPFLRRLTRARALSLAGQLAFASCVFFCIKLKLLRVSPYR